MTALSMPALPVPRLSNLAAAAAPALLPDLDAIRPPSEEQRTRELDTVRELVAARTPQDVRDIARHDDILKIWKDHVSEYKDHAGMVQGLKGAKLVGEAITKAGAASQVLKERYDLPRPYQVDPGIEVAGIEPPGGDSFPSGHASVAYAAANVMGSLWPERRRELLTEAAAISRSRVLAGVHFPSDVAAGRKVGELVAQDVLNDD